VTPWERPGGTTFHFVNDGIEPALDQAREAAGDRDVRIARGGATILEYVNASLINEFTIALSPVLFGSGIRLFEGVDAGRVALEPVRTEPTQRVTHLTYAVRERQLSRPQRSPAEVSSAVRSSTRRLRRRLDISVAARCGVPGSGRWQLLAGTRTATKFRSLSSVS